MSPLFVNQLLEEKGKEKLKRESNVKEERREKELLSNLVANRLVGGREKKTRGEERGIRGDQMERARAGRNDEKRGELLSNLPVNRCNRCNQLCLQVKREASQHQSQQSASGWGQGLRKLLCRGAACNSVISPVRQSVMETPRCPRITPDPAENDKGTGMMQKDTHAGKEEGQGDEEQRNPRRIQIRAAQDVEENMCKPAISGVTFPCRDAACEEEICLVLKPHRETARDPAISLVPASFSRTVFSQRQTIPAGRGAAGIAPSPRCSAQQTESELRITDVTLPTDSLSETSQRAKKRKAGALEPATPRKKRRRGRRQMRRFANVLMQRQKRIHAGLTSDLSVAEACSSELSSDNTPQCCPAAKTTDFHRTKCSLCHEPTTGEGTLSRNATDKLCCCDDGECSRGTANGCSPAFDPSGGKGTHGRDWNTCNTPTHSRQGDEEPIKDTAYQDSAICGASCDNSCNINDANVDRHSQVHKADLSDGPDLETPVQVICAESFPCSTNDLCQSENKHTDNNTNCNFCTTDDTFEPNCVSNDETKPHKNTPSDSGGHDKSCRSVDQSDADGGQCDGFTSNPDYNRRGNAVNSSSSSRNEAERVLRREQREDERVKEQQGKEEEERNQLERRRVREKQEEWEKEWVRRKEKEEKERERRKEIEFEHLFSEKRFPHHLPSQCIPLHAPLLLQPSLSSCSSFSFHHTFIQHHLSLLPPPSHLPVSSYPHLLPSFSSHLSPLTLSPPSAPPPPPPPPPHSFYASSTIPLLDGPGPFPLAAAFHPMQSHHPPLYPPPHAAVLPLQVLF